MPEVLADLDALVAEAFTRDAPGLLGHDCATDSRLMPLCRAYLQIHRAGEHSSAPRSGLIGFALC